MPVKAAVLTGIRKMEIRDIPEPQITKANQIKVRVLVCGLCASEIECWTGEKESIGNIIGHEPVGIVVEKGAEVMDFDIGDRVAAGFCHFAFADYVVQDASLFAKVPEWLPDEAAIGEPPSCALGAVQRVPLDLGTRVAVVGCGYMGLLVISMLKLRGCACITAVDNRQEALDRALDYGADEVYRPSQLKPEHFVDGFHERTFVDGFDAVFEVTGNGQALQMASRMVKGHGYLEIVGFHTGFREIDMRLWNIKGLNVINGHDKRMGKRGEYIRTYMELVRCKKVSFEALMTNGYSLEEIDRGFSDMVNKTQGYIKGYVRVNRKE